MTIEELPSPTRCADCGTWLPGDALTCPSCGRERDLPVAGVQRRSINPRTLIVGGGAAALVAIGMLIGWATGPPSAWGPSPSPALASAVAQTSPTPSLAPLPRPSPHSGVTMIFGAGRVRLALQFGAGWEFFGPDYSNYITKDVSGPQGAEALIYWTDFSGRRIRSVGEPCYRLRPDHAGLSAAALAAVVAETPGTDLITRPSEVRLGGYPAQHVVLIVREDVGCDPGFFFTYPNVIGGALWPETTPGDTIRVWIVEAEGDLLFIAGETKPDAGAALEQEVDDIVQAIAFPPVQGAP